MNEGNREVGNQGSEQQMSLHPQHGKRKREETEIEVEQREIGNGDDEGGMEITFSTTAATTTTTTTTTAVNTISLSTAYTNGEEKHKTQKDEKKSKKKRVDDDGWYKEPDLRWSEGTWINCDVRYFNFSPLAGKFEIIHLDPPWRIKGSEAQTSTQSMFTNAPFSLNYNTLSNEEIMDIDVGCLSRKGFIFLWVINSQMNAALECMRKWGYEFVDQIVWIKKTKYDNIAISQGYYFLHSTEICLIGVKAPDDPSFRDHIHKVSNDIIFSEVRQKSRKPDQIYTIMEAMLPGAYKIELFARNHNIRPGWLSLGNQLGEYYDWDYDSITCDDCHNEIELRSPRYKARFDANRDICKKCFEKSNLSENAFFVMENNVGEMVFHEYIECDNCTIQPIPGIRFTCTVCDGFDLCESCYDQNLEIKNTKNKNGNNHLHYHQNNNNNGERIHKKLHNFKAIELPELAGGLPIHRLKCAGCKTFPIIGYCFTCAVCVYLYLCQKCFFMKKEPKEHKVSHKVHIFIESDTGESFEIKCDCCGVRPIVGNRYKCDSCFNFDLCEKCYQSRATIPARFVSHKPNHSFTVFNSNNNNNGTEPSSRIEEIMSEDSEKSEKATRVKNNNGDNENGSMGEKSKEQKPKRKRKRKTA